MKCKACGMEIATETDPCPNCLAIEESDRRTAAARVQEAEQYEADLRELEAAAKDVVLLLRRAARIPGRGMIGEAGEVERIAREGAALRLERALEAHAAWREDEGDPRSNGWVGSDGRP